MACATLDQEWRARCVDAISPADAIAGTGETGPTHFGPGEEVDIGSLDSSGWLSGGSCMDDINVDLGMFGDVTIPFSEWCSLFSIIGIIVMIMAYLAGAKIVIGGF